MKGKAFLLIYLFICFANCATSAPFIVAHRGYSAAAPENTIPAFKLAAETGSAGIELDLLFTKDNQLVVFHDLTLDRTTNCSGYLSNYTYAELSNCDASFVDGKDFQQYRGTKIPLFSDVAKLAYNYSMFVVIDYKSLVPIGSSVTQILDAEVDAPITFVSCWYPWQIIGTPRQLVTSGINWAASGFWQMIVGGGVNGFSIRFTNTTKEFVTQAHSRLLSVAVWTVNNETDMETMVSYGVDAIITDYPPLLAQVISKYNVPKKDKDYVTLHVYTVGITAAVILVVVIVSLSSTLFLYCRKRHTYIKI